MTHWTVDSGVVVTDTNLTDTDRMLVLSEF